MKIAAIFFALSVSVSASATAADNTSPTTYGHLAMEGTASRTISITPRTRAINVHDGETVRLDVNGKTFEWTFDIPTRNGMISLSDIAPTATETGSGRVRVYVSPNPLYLG